MQHGVAPTLTDTPVVFTLKNIVALTLKMVLYLPWKSNQITKPQKFYNNILTLKQYIVIMHIYQQYLLDRSNQYEY